MGGQGPSHNACPLCGPGQKLVVYPNWETCEKCCHRWVLGKELIKQRPGQPRFDRKNKR